MNEQPESSSPPTAASSSSIMGGNFAPATAMTTAGGVRTPAASTSDFGTTSL